MTGVALFDVNGALVYSAAKRDDFGLSAGAGGALENTGIGRPSSCGVAA